MSLCLRFTSKGQALAAQATGAFEDRSTCSMDMWGPLGMAPRSLHQELEFPCGYFLLRKTAIVRLGVCIGWNF